jgi:tRNA (cytidine56-2'-O)-methyltransferase
MLEEEKTPSIKVSQNPSFVVAVLRIGHRLVRDDRTTTHAVLVSRAFGCERIYMTDVDDEIKDTLNKVNKRWGGEKEFKLEIIDNWKQIIKDWKQNNGIVVHLTMYGALINEKISQIRALNQNILVIIGAEKVPKEVYFLSDYNIAIGSQPHSEIAALAVFLDRIFEGNQFKRKLTNESVKIIPSERGKNVIKKK